MIRTSFIASLALSSVAIAGDWTADGNHLSFTGPVEGGDSIVLDYLLQQAAGHDVIVDIETPGGLASEGIFMTEALAAYPGRVVTRAVGSGAWSAGAMMWIAGDQKLVATDSVVGFHLAYVPGCMSCDTSGINGLIGGVIANAGMQGDRRAWPFLRTLLLDMAQVRDQYGPQGFVMLGGDGDRDLGNWWDFYPSAAELIDQGDDHVGRTNEGPALEPRPVTD